jgi:hypothetical protein
MAGKRIYMSKQSEVLRLKALDHSKSEITCLLGIDRATVRRYWDGPPLTVEINRDAPDWVLEIDWEHILKQHSEFNFKSALLRDINSLNRFD